MPLTEIAPCGKYDLRRKFEGDKWVVRVYIFDTYEQEEVIFCKDEDESIAIYKDICEKYYKLRNGE